MTCFWAVLSSLIFYLLYSANVWPWLSASGMIPKLVLEFWQKIDLNEYIGAADGAFLARTSKIYIQNLLVIFFFGN